jgi:BlaI family transcriptional regulator, penicillinase repressor
MEKKQLTKAEEQIMQQLWTLEKAFLKDIIELLPEPKPHSNTVATILKILVDKGFVDIKVVGRIHQYFPTISKAEYSSNYMGTMVENYFEGSFAEAVSFMVDQKQLSIKDLELLLNQLKTTTTK